MPRNEDVKFEESFLFHVSDPARGTVRHLLHSDLKEVRFLGKTGTTNNGLDNWYTFYDGQNMGVIWFGLEGNREDKALRVAGSSTSFRIYQHFSRFRGKRFGDLHCPQSK